MKYARKEDTLSWSIAYAIHKVIDESNVYKYETMTQLEVAKRQGYIQDYMVASELATEIRKMLNSMIKKLKA